MPATFELLPESHTADKVKRDKEKERPRASSPPPAEPKPPMAPPVPSLPILLLSQKDFAASDISKLTSHRDEGSADASDSSSSAYGPGEGPGGVRLYEAEWYRRPTDAELAFYMPADAPRTGWGLIACQTVERFHVDNCRILGESPLGSGLGRAVREAAWQFLVLPPRIGGHKVVGAWVRIRIDYTQSEAK
ncbi:hypothetical protein [Rhizorhapis sp. SPR117]|uniref:hypothetical protein n=1 Tax=Rhizorhapis sp. SPR117 TaxID=2912611 RepID=UPI001F2846E3|nr:hypothetical protein [Rhizorhapis sp. SPR117]